MNEIEPYWARISRLRVEQGLSQDALFRRCGDISYETLRRVQRDPAKYGGTNGNARYPSLEVLRAVAQGLGIDPEEFPEFRLAVMRRWLDERTVGLADAVRTLDDLTSRQVLADLAVENPEIFSKFKSIVGVVPAHAIKPEEGKP